MKKIYKLAPFRLILLLLSALIIALFECFKNNYTLMSALAEKVVKPFRMSLSYLSSRVSFSIAEVLIAIFVIWLVIYLISRLIRLIHLKEGRGAVLYKLILTPLSWVMAVYALFCLFWGVYYYGDDFMTKAGLEQTPISVSQLETVTQYFADLANSYSSRIDRDYSKNCSIDRNAVLEVSDKVYSSTAKRIPYLSAPDVKAKGIKCSKIMSLIDFTGFFFPFTGEANVNMDSPSAYFPATVAHELAHLRGVAKEDEANFVAVIACMEYGDPAYVYSAALTAYTYLGNALYSADYNSWLSIYSSLNDNVKRDISENNNYWEAYKTPVEEISNTVYENFLYSYGQELGLKTYGACVDLLVDYYYDLVSSGNNAD